MIDDLIINESQTISITIDVPLSHWEKFCDYAYAYGFEGKDFLLLSIIFDTVSTPNFKKLKHWKMSELGLISEFNQFK